MSAPQIGVLALQGDVREHAAALEASGARAVGVRRPHELAGLDGIVIPGGESTTIDKLLRIFELFDPLQAAIAAGMPAYGSCAGMILLADRIIGGIEGQQTLGGLDITVRRNAFGRQVDSFEGDVVMEGIEDPERALHAVFIRAPWVEEVGPNAEVIARVSDVGHDGHGQGGPAHVADASGTGRIVAVRQGRVMATSFHPEITADFRVHRLFVDLARGNG